MALTGRRRYWSVAIPTYLLVLLSFFLPLVYLGLNLASTAPLSSPHIFTGERLRGVSGWFFLFYFAPRGLFVRVPHNRQTASKAKSLPGSSKTPGRPFQPPRRSVSESPVGIVVAPSSQAFQLPLHSVTPLLAAALARQ